MGSLSLWHWAVVLGPILVAWLAERFNTRNGTLSRMNFSCWVVGVGVVYAVVYFGITGSITDPNSPAFYALLTLQVLVAPGLIAYWAVDRLRDMGETKKQKAILVGVPFVGLFYVLYLMFAKGSSPGTKAAQGSA